MEYLTVGTNEIKKDLFIPVKDNTKNIFKPTGGLWLTKYDERYKNYNDWVDYLIIALVCLLNIRPTSQKSVKKTSNISKHL